MSLRPEISGFSLSKFHSLFGSGDQQALAEVTNDFKGFVTFDEPEDLDLGKQVIERAIVEGVPFDDLDTEGEPHVWAAVVLARYGQWRYETGSNYWHMGVLYDLRDALSRRLSPEGQKLLGYFSTGRPIFGKRIETDWSYYGYLSLEEVKALFSALDAVKKKVRHREGKEFLNDFLVWFDEISNQGLDLWFYTY